MKKMILTSSALLIFGMILALGCNKTSTPYGINAPNGLDVPSPTSTAIVGSIYVDVQDLDFNAIYPNVEIQAIPPDNSITITASSGITGVAAFTPPQIETGLWTFRIPVQNALPFTTSTMTAPINSANQTVTFASGQGTIALTPTALTQYSSTNGGIFTYNLVYNQPNPLHIPVTFKFPTLPHNWSINDSSATIGFGGSEQTSVTVSTSGCVDQAPSFAVTAIDSIGNTRAEAAPVTITHSFPATVALVLTTNSTGQPYTSCQAPPMCSCSGYNVNAWYCSVNLSYTNACNQGTTVVLYKHEDNGGSNCCGEGAWWNASNWIGTNNCGSWAATVVSSSGSSNDWPLTVVNTTQGGRPYLSFALYNNNFPQGLTGRVNVPSSGAATILSANNW